jgi:nitrate reductase gamma subunit
MRNRSMNAIVPLLGVLLLVLAAYAGVAGAGLHKLFGLYLPAIAILTFLAGIVARVFRWASSAVPFRIPTTCGQEKSLKFLPSAPLESPSGLLGVLGRMALEVLLFRSLFRNTKTDVAGRSKLVFGPTKWLWGAGLAFHYAFLVIFIRHFKYFAEPTPGFVLLAQSLDSFFQVGLPILYLTDVIIVVALSYLLARRVLVPAVRYISLPADFFALFLILGIATTGILMRYFYKVDVVEVKKLGTALLGFQSFDPSRIGNIFFVHLFLVSALIAYFPFSKLVHMAGVFLSPTRNLANNNRMYRHVNPWNHPVKVHHYEEWQEEFKEKIEAAGLPMDVAEDKRS